MKKVILIPIIVGSALLLTGGIVLAIGVTNSVKASNYVEKEYEVTDAFTNIDINFDITDVKLIKSEDGKTKIAVKETEKERHEYTVSDNTLSIKFVDERKWSEKMFSWEQLKVTVYLPAGNYGDLKIDTDTGDVEIPGDFTFNSVNYTGHTGDFTMSSNVAGLLKTKITTGDISFANFTANEIDINGGTGKISLENVKVTEKIFTKNSTGNVKLNNVQSKKLESHTSTGNVTLTNTVMSEQIWVETSTGNVKFVDSDALDIHVETSTGNVTGTLLTGKVFTYDTSSGKHSLPPHDVSGGTFYAKTSTGDIVIKIKG